MSPQLTPEPTHPDSIELEIEIAASPERVFAALTVPRQLEEWWSDEGCGQTQHWEVEGRLGGKWKATGSDKSGTWETRGDIIEFEPPRLLAYTWVEPLCKPGRLISVVRYELQATREGTLVKLSHSGFAPYRVAWEDSQGWPPVLRLLEKHFAEEHTDAPAGPANF